MELNPEEMAELESLRKEFSTQRGPAQSSIQNDLSPEEMSELQALRAEFSTQSQEGPGILENIGSGIMSGLSAAGEFVDSYSGAPTRAALDALIRGEGGGAAAQAFTGQFGQDPSLAPTGKDIAKNAGLSDESALSFKVPVEGAQGRIVNQPGTNKPLMKEEVSPAGVAGLAIDIGADPLNFIPVGFIAKGGAKLTGKAAKEGSKLVLKGTVAAADAALDSTVVSRTAKDAARAVDNVMAGVKRRFNPSRAEDFEKYADIAKRNNISTEILPETVEFGPQSTITKKAKNVAEGPGGEAVQQRYLQAQNEVAVAVDNQVKRLGGGEKLLDSEAGQMLTDSYNRGIKQFFDQDMLTHSKIIKENPGMVLNQDALKSVQSRIKGLKNRATGRTRRGFGGQREEATNFLKDADILEKSFDKNGNLSYKRSSELLSNMGEEAFKKYPPGTKIPTDQKALQELYFSLRDAMYESVSHTKGSDIATEMAMNNEIISKFLKEQGAVKKIFDSDIASEKVWKSIIENGDTKKLEAMKEILSPEDFQRLKSVVAEKLIKRNADGDILYRTTLNNIERKKELVAKVFQPEEIAELGDVLSLGDRVGDFVFNKSGTNTASRFNPKEFLGSLVGSATDEVTLERLKDIARGKVQPIPFTPGQSVGTPVKAGASTLRQIPILESRSRQLLESGRVSSIQDRNKEIERRKRAISGGR